jgi:hypothetical protein
MGGLLQPSIINYQLSTFFYFLFRQSLEKQDWFSIFARPIREQSS